MRISGEKGTRGQEPMGQRSSIGMGPNTGLELTASSVRCRSRFRQQAALRPDPSSLVGGITMSLPTEALSMDLLEQVLTGWGYVDTRARPDPRAGCRRSTGILPEGPLDGASSSVGQPRTSARARR